jgi:lysophospholipase L1-like esterase
LRRFLAAILGLVVGLLLCEAATRLLSDRLLSLQHPAVRFDPELGWVQQAGAMAVRHNEAGQEIVLAGSRLGIREPPVAYRFGKDEEVLLLGDSLTAGTQVLFADTWAAQLQERLKRRHPTLEIVNAGIDRYDLAQEYRLARRLWSTVRPTHVILGLYLGNDIADYDVEAGARPPWRSGGPLVWLREHSYLYHYVQGALAKARRRHAPRPPRVASPVDGGWSPHSVPGFAELGREEQARIRGQFASGDVLGVLRGGEEAERRLVSTERVLSGLATLVRERGAGLTVVLLPMKVEIIPAQRAEWMALQGLSEDDVERARRHLLAFAAKQGIRMVDVAPALRAQSAPEDLYWKVDLHMTPRGHAALADALAPVMDEALRPARTGSVSPTSSR